MTLKFPIYTLLLATSIASAQTVIDVDFTDVADGNYTVGSSLGTSAQGYSTGNQTLVVSGDTAVANGAPAVRSSAVADMTDVTSFSVGFVYATSTSTAGGLIAAGWALDTATDTVNPFGSGTDNRFLFGLTYSSGTYEFAAMSRAAWVRSISLAQWISRLPMGTPTLSALT